MVALLRRFYLLILSLWRPPQRLIEPEVIEPPKPEPEPEPAPDPPPPPPPPPEPPPPQPQNRKTRRAMEAWERQRRKRDKFVTPKGPKPIAEAPRVMRVTKPIPKIEDEIGDGHRLIQGDDGTVYDESELWGIYNFRDTILDQLERYWVYLRRMKQRDPDSYGFYRQVGATVVPLAKWLLQDGVRTEDERDPPKQWKKPELSPWWRKHRPAFGCVTYGISSRIESDEMSDVHKDTRGRVLWVPKFLYITKYTQPQPNVQPTTNGDVYKMTVWWDRPQDHKVKSKHGTAYEYAVYVSHDGSDIHVLRMLDTRYISVPEKKNGLKKIDIPQRAWKIPKEYASWAKEHGSTADNYLSTLFCDAARAVEYSQYSMVRVAVAHSDLTAVFGVEIKRTPYFFQDRDITLTESGRKQRIFHIVRAHTRKDGTRVPFHFRGLREFEWAGYKVKITVPGRDHFMPVDYDVGAIDEHWIEPCEKTWTEPQVGKWLAEGMAAGVGGRRR